MVDTLEVHESHYNVPTSIVIQVCVLSVCELNSPNKNLKHLNVSMDFWDIFPFFMPAVLLTAFVRVCVCV